MQSSTGMLTGACAAGGDLRECVALSLPESPQPEQVLSGLPLDLPGPTQPEKTLQRLGGAQALDTSSHAGAHWEEETLDAFFSSPLVLRRLLSFPADPHILSRPLQKQEPLPSPMHPSGA